MNLTEAFVGFEQTEYFSSEGGGMLIIWVTVKLNNSDVYKCPVGYDFEVDVTTHRISASELLLVIIIQP